MGRERLKEEEKKRGVEKGKAKIEVFWWCGFSWEGR